jgi:autoinducer 2-degrading protein
MIVTTVHVFVKPEFIEAFKEASIKNHENSIQEPGNMRFDILQAHDDESRFLLYEAYETEEAAKAHKQTAHYLEWRETVAPMMAKPREGVPYKVIAPQHLNNW